MSSLPTSISFSGWSFFSAPCLPTENNLEDKKELATEYFEIICNKTSINEKTIEKWFPIVAVNQLAKGIEKQEEVLTSFIQSIKF